MFNLVAFVTAAAAAVVVVAVVVFQLKAISLVNLIATACPGLGSPSSGVSLSFS